MVHAPLFGVGMLYSMLY